MHPGPYLVIPLYGPSTLREGIGFAADYGTLLCHQPRRICIAVTQSWGLGVLNAVDQRANIDFRYYASGSPFEYETIRFLYVRKLLIEDAGLHKHEPPQEARPRSAGGRMSESPATASVRDRAVGIVATGTILAILYFARDVLVPITLAVILSLVDLARWCGRCAGWGSARPSSVLARRAGARAAVRRPWRR